MPERQRKACAVLIICILFFLVCSSGVVLLLILDARTANILPPDFGAQGTAQSSASDTGSGAGIQKENAISSFPGGVLLPSEDAGQDYIDETLFIGDSNTVRMYVYGLVPLENIMALEGMGIESVTGLPCVYFTGESRPCTIPQAIARVKPRRIVMTFGTNNANGTYSVESFLDLYRDAVQAIQDTYPDCDLILNAIPPVCKRRSYPDTEMETIEAFNQAILTLAEEKHLPYLNSSEALIGADGYAIPEYWVEDGLHMNRSALETLLEYVRTHAYITEDRRGDIRPRDIPDRRASPGWQKFS